MADLEIDEVQLNGSVDKAGGKKHVAGNAINILLALKVLLNGGPRPVIRFHGWIGNGWFNRFVNVIEGAGAISLLFSIQGKTRVNKLKIVKGKELFTKGPNGYRVGQQHLDMFFETFNPKPGSVWVVTGSEPTWEERDDLAWKETTANFLIDLISRILAAGAQVWLDVSPDLLEVVFSTPFVRPNLLKVNREELLRLAQLAGFVLPEVERLDDEIAPLVAFRVAQKYMPNGTFIATFGRYLFARYADGEVFLLRLRLPNGHRRVSTVGRGDRAMACLLAGLWKGMSRLDTLLWAMTVRVSGTTSPAPHKYDEALAGDLVEQVAHWLLNGT